MIAVGVESNCMHFNGREREGVNSEYMYDGEIMLYPFLHKQGYTK